MLPNRDQAIFDYMKDRVEKIGSSFINANDDWESVTIIFGKKSVTVHQSTFRDDFEKRRMFSVEIPLMIRKLKARAVGFVASSWMLIPSEEEIELTRTHNIVPRPSTHKDRIEVVFLSYFTSVLEESSYARIIRSDTQPPKLGLWERFPANYMLGSMIPESTRSALCQVNF